MQAFSWKVSHDLDHLDPSLPFGDVVQGLYGTDTSR